jgi:LytS/YehU family sensor histidine kinase
MVVNKDKKEIKEAAERDAPFKLKALIAGLIFGALALCVVLIGIHIPIPGVNVVTDPRELFTTLGAALSGPIGGILVGFLAGIAEPGGIPLASLLAHIVGAVFLGFAYKKIVYRLKGFLMYLGWIAAVLIYYYVFAITGFAVGVSLFYNDPTPILQSYLALAKGVISEAILASIVTTLVLFALPKKYRKPLW